jgi:hypothetical protein
MWILKDGEYLMVEGGHKVCFTPLSHSSKILKVFDRSRCSSDFYLRKDGHSIVSISSNEIAIARKDGKVFFLLPGIHHLGCNEIFDKSIKLSAFMERIGSDISYNEIGESGFGVLAVANKPKGYEEKFFILWETLIMFANGTFKVLMPGYYAYENNNYPLQKIMFLRQKKVSYKKELNQSGVYLEYHFGIKLPSKDDFKSLKIGQKDYAEHIRALLDDKDPQSRSSLIKKVGEILEEIIDIKSQNFDPDCDESNLYQHKRDLESAIQTAIKAENDLLSKTSGMSIDYAGGGIDKKGRYEHLGIKRNRLLEMEEVAHKNKVFELEYKRHKKEIELENMKKRNLAKVKTVVEVDNTIDKAKDL